MSVPHYPPLPAPAAVATEAHASESPDGGMAQEEMFRGEEAAALREDAMETRIEKIRKHVETREVWLHGMADKMQVSY